MSQRPIVHRLALAGLAAVAAFAPEAHVNAARAQAREWEWTGRVDRGDAVEIRNVKGAIRVEPARGGEVEVAARLRGGRSDTRDVRIEVVEHGGGVTVCAVYPSGEPGRRNECRPGVGARGRVRGDDVVVDFNVRLPAGLNFSGHTVNGDVDIENIDGDVEARTVNGKIDVSAKGLIEASTVNGSITASLGRADWQGTLEFTTVNGNVTLELPENLNCDLDVSSVNGSISSDFPITVTGKFSPRSLRGTIGRGGRRLRVKTVNGNVYIRRV